MFYATPAQKADPSMYAEHYPSGLGLNQPTSEAMNASVNHDATSREMIAKQTLGAAAGAGAIVLAPKVAVAAGLGTGYDYAGDVISRAMGLSNGEPSVGKSLVVGSVAGVAAPFFLPLSTLGGSTAGKIVVGGYNSVLAGTGVCGHGNHAVRQPGPLCGYRFDWSSIESMNRCNNVRTCGGVYKSVSPSLIWYCSSSA
ncbi:MULTISPECIES: hypothetical protein [Burkholderiaceae]|uniref:hypothetical protein n=1 Tax=Burkholderiaceae TaxID=119060 RepID=UPI000958F8BF|nr:MULTISPECIES: hypothetical protein [Burkholderiaceae]MCG1018699.1 hypothetical protein [Mycetohabitans sp. B4]SIT75265.1 filamentous hemagglutinin [Burkholderia sp. b13]